VRPLTPADLAAIAERTGRTVDEVRRDDAAAQASVDAELVRLLELCDGDVAALPTLED